MKKKKRYICCSRVYLLIELDFGSRPNDDGGTQKGHHDERRVLDHRLCSLAVALRLWTKKNCNEQSHARKVCGIDFTPVQKKT